MTQATRYITTWREPKNILDWDYYVSQDLDEAKRAVANIVEQGVKQYRTYVLGDNLPDLSSEY